MIYTSARFADEAHTLVIGTDSVGNTETVPIDYTLFRQPEDGPQGFLARGGVIEPYASASSLPEAIVAKLSELDDYRWQMEIGGVSFAGAFIRTDANSQAKIAAVYTMARLDPDYEVPVWEVMPGVFMPLDNATIIAMGETVRDHVQATFNRKAVLHGQIAALESVEAVEAFDIVVEWDNTP